VLVIWYLDQLARQASFVKANIFYGRIRSALGMLLYSKVSSLSNNAIKNSEFGKITNLIASDLGALEFWPLSFSIALFPLLAIGSIALLVLRMGWPGILGILVAMLTFPLSTCISRYNGSLFEQANIHKDRRIETTSEVIEGIKFVKLYGWEAAFRKMIHSIRQL
jgi:ABC-type multidrug transport system fused ATPase/permease subunit